MYSVTASGDREPCSILYTCNWAGNLLVTRCATPLYSLILKPLLSKKVTALNASLVLVEDGFTNPVIDQVNAPFACSKLLKVNVS